MRSWAQNPSWDLSCPGLLRQRSVWTTVEETGCDRVLSSPESPCVAESGTRRQYCPLDAKLRRIYAGKRRIMLTMLLDYFDASIFRLETGQDDFRGGLLKY